MPATFPHSKRNPATLIRDPRTPPTASEKAERLKAREVEAKLAWEEYRQKQQAVDANTARLKALRLAREKKAVG